MISRRNMKETTHQYVSTITDFISILTEKYHSRCLLVISSNVAYERSNMVIQHYEWSPRSYYNKVLLTGQELVSRSLWKVIHSFTFAISDWWWLAHAYTVPDMMRSKNINFEDNLSAVLKELTWSFELKLDYGNRTRQPRLSSFQLSQLLERAYR